MPRGDNSLAGGYASEAGSAQMWFTPGAPRGTGTSGWSRCLRDPQLCPDCARTQPIATHHLTPRRLIPLSHPDGAEMG